MGEDGLPVADGTTGSCVVPRLKRYESLAPTLQVYISADGDGDTRPKPEDAIVVQVSAKHADTNAVGEKASKNAISRGGSFEHPECRDAEQAEEQQQQRLADDTFLKHGFEKQL